MSGQGAACRRSPWRRCGVCASTGFGLLISAFVRTQVAQGIFAAAILSVTPAVNFSGLLYPRRPSKAGQVVRPVVPLLLVPDGQPRRLHWGLGFSAFTHGTAALGACALAFLLAARIAVRKQER